MTLDLYARALQRLAQLGFLSINVITIAAARSTADCGSDQGAFGAILFAGGGRTDHCAADRTNTAINTCLASFSLTGIGIVGTADQQRKGGGECGQVTDLLHIYFLHLRDASPLQHGLECAVRVTPARRRNRNVPTNPKRFELQATAASPSFAVGLEGKPPPQ